MALLYAFVLACAYVGRDFGLHWDEHLFGSFVDRVYRGHGGLPGHYIYPSFCYYLSLGCGILFNSIYEIPNGFSYGKNQDFIRFCRVVYAAVASLSVVWIYGAVLALTRRYRYALLAGLLLCGSFEFGYHARWAVSDLIAVQFACLSAMITCLDLDPRRRLIYAAVAAGLAAGAKYTAGIAVVPVVVLFVSENRTGPWMRWRWAYATLALLAFALAFIATTPGSVLQFRQFVADIIWQRNIYAGGHFVYTVQPGLSHLGKMLAWMVLSGLSPWPLVSAAFAILVLWGAVQATRRRQPRRLSLFLVVALYLAFFATFRVMVVRNLMIVIPLCAAMAAWGAQALIDRLRQPAIARAVTAGLFVAAGLSATGVARAAWSVKNRNEAAMAMALDAYLERHPGRTYAFSPKVLPMVSLPVSTEPRADRYLVFRKDEIKWEHFQPNEFMLYEPIGGPLDVNINYYPTWPGDDRILIMPFRRANSGTLADVGFK